MLALLVSLLPVLPAGAGAPASHTPTPSSVNLAGSLESEATNGACGDWDPGCVSSRFTAQPNGVYLFNSAAIPAGAYEYKVAMGSWSENYGANYQQDGPNIGLTVEAERRVRFYYDHKTHYIADNVRNAIYTVPGSFGPRIGCGEWAPDCLGSLMSDTDGDGVHTFVTDDIPAGAYEFKVATNESWNNPNYGAGGGADNVKFTVSGDGATVTFSFDTASRIPGVKVVGGAPTGPGQDGDIFWDGLGHDSRDALYRVPGGAVTQNSNLLLRFRTFHNDATSVTLRTYHTGVNAERLYDMKRVATDVPCYDPSLKFGCDFWQAEVDAGQTGIIYYRFIVKDGAKTVYYEDDSDVRDGGWGKAFNESPDWGWVLTVYDSDFKSPIKWMKEGVVYQIFPDRFRNEDPSNDPTPAKESEPQLMRPVGDNDGSERTIFSRLSSDPRYAYPHGDPGGAAQPEWDQIVRMRWGDLPEGYCRNYQNVVCPVRFVQPPTARENPRGRDYYGGDLEGVTRKLNYLEQLGVTVIYFNPVFAAGSNHRYDTRDYRIIDPYLGDLGDWRTLEQAARMKGMRIILDGVFNHMSSDSPLFDRYHNFDYREHGVGACESVDSPYRKWFRFRKPNANEPAACAPYTGDGESYYESWAGFDSLPQLSEDPVVQREIFDNENSVARYWIKQGADGWRLDVMQDKSIPFWEGFRTKVKDADPEAIIIGELWKKFDVLPYVQGNTADTAMNYRLRDAVLGLLAPGAFDAKGFPGSGQPLSPSAFVDRLESVREDYPDAAYYSLMNLLDSHDTERLLWTLTPGAENTEEREANAANVAEGKARQRLAALIQMTMPGAPTVYYGDEVALTGDDDPDDRRTYPWGDGQVRNEGDTRQPDREMYAYYRELTRVRQGNQVLLHGPVRWLLEDNEARTVAYGRKQGDTSALIALNASEEARTLGINVAGYLPDGTRLVGRAGSAPRDLEYIVSGGKLSVQLPPLTGLLLLTQNANLTPTTAPDGLRASAQDLRVSLEWNPAADASGYNVYRSPVTGGGYVKVNGLPVSGNTYTDSEGLRSGQRYYYVVRSLDSVGNESADSNEASAVPSYRIDWANLQWPPTLDYEVSAANTTDPVYGQVYIEGVTNRPGATTGLLAQLRYGEQNTDPTTWTTWAPMEFNGDRGNNDEYKGVLQPADPGMYSYFTRYSTNAGESWTYGDLDGIEGGSFAEQTDRPGTLTVRPNRDQEAPAPATNLRAFNNGATSISLEWI